MHTYIVLYNMYYIYILCYDMHSMHTVLCHYVILVYTISCDSAARKVCVSSVVCTHDPSQSEEDGNTCT